MTETIGIIKQILTSLETNRLVAKIIVKRWEYRKVMKGSYEK